jgi:hypothetical protein
VHTKTFCEARTGGNRPVILLKKEEDWRVGGQAREIDSLHLHLKNKIQKQRAGHSSSGWSICLA